MFNLKQNIIKASTVCALLLANKAFSQDIHFSLYNEAPLALNPALACTKYDFRASANYKTQWSSVATPFKTYAFATEFAFFHKKLKPAYMSSSLSAWRDMSGDAKYGTTHLNLSLGGVVTVAKNQRLSAAMQAGYTMKSANTSALKWENQYNGFQYDAALPSGETNVSNYNYGDFAGGLNWHYSRNEMYISASNALNIDIGAAHFHFKTPKQSLLGVASEQLYGKLVFHANFNIGIKNSSWILDPSLIYMQQGPAREINPGMMFKYIIQEQAVYTGLKKPSALGFGANYRFGDAFIISSIFEYDKFALGVAYDINVSGLNGASRTIGGLEFSLRYNMNPGYGKRLGAGLTKPTYK